MCTTIRPQVGRFHLFDTGPSGQRSPAWSPLAEAWILSACDKCSYVRRFFPRLFQCDFPGRRLLDDAMNYARLYVKRRSLKMTFPMRRICGLCGSSGVSLCAWACGELRPIPVDRGGQRIPESDAVRQRTVKLNRTMCWITVQTQGHREYDEPLGREQKSFAPIVGG